MNPWSIARGLFFVALAALNLSRADLDDPDAAHGFAAAVGLLWGADAVVRGVKGGAR